MNQFDTEEEQLIARARRVFSPAPSDAERVLATTRQAIAAGLAPRFAGGQAEPANARVVRAVRDATGTLGARIIAAACIVGAAAALGYRAGLHEGRSEERARPVAPGAAALSSTREPTTSHAVSSVDPRRSESDLASQHQSAAGGARHRAPAPPLKKLGEENHEARTSVTAHGASLEEEARMLARVERALREQNPQQALVLLGELDRKLPGGQLGEERAAAFAVARCSLGLGASVTTLQEFSQQFPSSVYFGRVRQACAAGEAEALPSEP